MLEFQSVTKRDAARLHRYYRNCRYGLCEYSVGTKLMWRKALRPGDAPSADFVLCGDKAVAVYAFCDLHGLWKTAL